MYKVVVLLMFSLLLSTGCSMKVPQTVEEFKQMVPQSTFGKQDQYIVKRSLARVTKNLKKKSKECLNKTLERTACFTSQYGGQSCSKTNIHFNPSVRAGKKKTSFVLQQSVEGAVRLFGKEPKGGDFSMVADITSAGKNKSKVHAYYSSGTPEVVVKAVKRWASGKTRGCPDLTQN